MKHFTYAIFGIFLFAHTTLSAQVAQPPADFEPFMPYRVGSMWGYSDTLGTIRYQPRFDSLGFFKVCYVNTFAARAVFLEKGKFGMIDHRLKVVIPPQYDLLQLHLIASGGFIQAKKGSRMGALTLDGLPLVPLLYDTALGDLFLTGILIEKGGKKGLYDINGKLLAKPEYDKISSHYGLNEQGKYGRLGYKAEKKDKTYFIDLNGKTIPFEQAKFPKPPLTDEVAVESPAPPHGTGGESAYAKKQRLQWESKELALANSLGVDSIKRLDPGNKFIKTMKNGKIGLAENEGKGRLMEPQFDEMPLAIYGHRWPAYKKIGSDHLFFVRNAGEPLRCIGDEGQLLFPFEMTEVWKDGFGRIRYKNGALTGIFIPHSPYALIPPIYESLEVVENLPQRIGMGFLVFKVRKNGRYGFLGMNGVEYFRE